MMMVTGHFLFCTLKHDRKLADYFQLEYNYFLTFGIGDFLLENWLL